MGSAMAGALENWDASSIDSFYEELREEERRAVGSYALAIEKHTLKELAGRYLGQCSRPDSSEYEFRSGKLLADRFIDNGRMDGVISPGVPPVVIVENKLKKSFTPIDLERLKVDEQVSSYIANGCREWNLSPSDISVRYDVIIKPGIRRKKTESFQDFKNRLTMLIRSDEYDLSPPNTQLTKIQQHDVTRTQYEIDNWNADTENLAEKIAGDEESDTFSKTTSSCFAFNRACEMFKLCSQSDSSKLTDTIRTYYDVEGQ